MHDYPRPPVGPLLPGGHGLLGLVDFALIGGDGVLVGLDRGGVRWEDHRAVVAGKVSLLVLGDLDAVSLANMNMTIALAKVNAASTLKMRATRT